MIWRRKLLLLAFMSGLIGLQHRPTLAQDSEATTWVNEIRAVPAECPMVNFPRTVYLPARSVPAFSDLPLTVAEWNLSFFSGTCYPGPPDQYWITLGDPNSSHAQFQGFSGRREHDSQAEGQGACRGHRVGFCSTFDSLNFTEYFYLMVRTNEAVVRHNITCDARTTMTLASCNMFKDFWEISWYDTAEDMSYSISLWDGVARRLGAPLTFEILDHRPYASRLAEIASMLVSVRVRQ
jgi:hypothetical protein